jgi:hypothetical protein
MSETLDLLQLELDGENVVYLHCRGGIGRTGTTLGCHLVRHGMDGGEALARLDTIGKRPETFEQEQLVADWRRHDRPGRLTRGSRIQIAIYVNRRGGELSQAVAGAIPELADRGARLAWTVPLLADGLTEPHDRQFLSAVGHEELGPSLADFWPSGGPVWDALAVVVFASGPPGVLLGEGKSHPGEFRSSCTASPASRLRIEEALAETQLAFGLEPNLEPWLERYYQSANRYAHLHWLRELGVEAWLTHLLFLDDRTHKPTSRVAWDAELPPIKRDLGVADRAIPHAADVFLPALEPVELTRRPQRA